MSSKKKRMKTIINDQKNTKNLNWIKKDTMIQNIETINIFINVAPFLAGTKRF